MYCIVELLSGEDIEIQVEHLETYEEFPHSHSRGDHQKCPSVW